MIDFTTYDDEELDALRVAVLTEQKRRARVAAAPQQIETLTREAIACGVPETAVREAVEDGLTPDQIASPTPPE